MTWLTCIECGFAVDPSLESPFCSPDCKRRHDERFADQARELDEESA
jgi:endogenous inhibitor of DNA gyrase (YacG/DUF329 family)